MKPYTHRLLNIAVVIAMVLMAVSPTAAWAMPEQSSAPAAASAPVPTVTVRLSAADYRAAPALSPIYAVDYGDFVWLEIPASQVSRLEASGLAYQRGETTIGSYSYKFDPVEGEPAIPANLRSEASAAEPGLYLIQFIGPINDHWLKDVSETGVKLLQYYAHNAYLVWGTGAQVAQANTEAYVRWSGVFQPAYKINPNLEGLTGRVENVAITFYNDGNLEGTLAAFKALGGDVLQSFPAQPDKAFYTAIVALRADRVTEAARLATVWALDYSSPRPGFDDENATQIVAGNYTSPTSIPTGYYAWLASKGVGGSGVTWADVDTGLNATHPDVTGRAIAFVSYPGAGAANTDPDGHGTHTAGAIMGDGRGGVGVVNPAAALDPNGFYWGTGMAPSSTLVVQNALMGSSWPPAGGWQVLSKDSVTNGAVGSSNSWYTGSYSNDYTAACRTHDLMVRDANFDTTTVAEPIIYIFSAGNGGPNYSTISEPHAAKNPVTVGATANYPRIGANIDGLAYFSSRGPATDGRYIPSVTAPGYQTASLNGSGANCGTTVAGAGAAYYNYCSGTSMAAPLVAGSSALIVDWWKQENAGAVPSPAMVKALLINSGDDMVGGNRAVGGTAGVIGNLPNNDQGWGRVNLNKVIRTGVPTLYYDQSAILGATGETWQKTLTAADPTKPVKISLVWTDAAGAAGANPALVNDLNLTVVNGGNTYRGNNFLGGWSTISTTVDNRNNMENVYLPAGATGALQITISGANIAGDGVPYNADITDQDFALVVYNARADGGTIAGTVTETTVTDGAGDPIVGAKIIATQGSNTFSALSGAGGLYSMFVPTGTYALNTYAYGFLMAQTPSVNVTLNATTTQNIALTPAADYVISGTVRDSVTTNPLWATVSIVGVPFNPPVTSVQTNPATGFYSLTVAAGQSYTLTVSALLHTTEVRGIGDPTGNQTQNFDLVATTTNGGLAGWVRNYYTTQPISGALVSAGGAYSGTTNAQGYYQILGLPAGYYTATASAPLYSPVTIANLQVLQSNVTLQDFDLPTSHMEYAPTALQRTVTFGTIVTDSAGLVITNTGLGALTFDLAEQLGGFAPSIGEGGGPDPYGYMWKSSNEAGGPTFNWIDATGGTALGLTDDGEANITSPFAFSFYGVSSTALRVGNNGGIFFNATTGDLSTTNTAMSSAPNNSIMTFWDDIDSDTGNVYWTVVGSAPNRRLVVEWYNRPHFSNIGAGTFEAVLFEDGDILYQYLDTDFGNASYNQGVSATAGIRGGSAANSLEHSYNTASLPDNYAICFDNPVSATACGTGGGSGALPWLNQVPVSGTLAGGSTTSQNIAIGWNAAAPEVTQPGLYTGSLKINNNDPVAQNVVLPVEMTVIPSATQGKVTGVVSSTGYCGTDIHPLANITVTLTGSGGYSKTLKTDVNGAYSWWVDTTNNPFTITAVAAEHTAGSAPGVTIVAGATPNVYDFTLTWLKPCVGNDPSSVSVTVQKGLTATAPLTLSNGGAATLNFELQERDGGFAPVDAPNAVDILVVGANTSSNRSITQALTTIGYSYLITTEAAFNATPVNDLLNYNAVIYASSSSTGLPNLVSYLDAGGNLLVVDNDLGFSNGSSTLYTQYLQATYGGDNAGDGNVVGEDIMNGITADITADPYPDYYTINGANTTRIFTYATSGSGNGGPAGSRTTRNSYNAIYLPFDIYYLGGSAVGDPVETEVIQRALGFLAPTDVTWFSESPITGTIAAAGSQPIEIAFDSSVPEVTQPGLYTATLLVKSNDPVNGRLSIPVAMNVTPLATEGKLDGTVTSLGYCDANPAPLVNANVLIQDAGGYSYTLKTNASGQYGPWWLNSGSYTVTVSAPEHPTTPAVVSISGGVTTTQNFNLRWLKPCVSVNPNSLSTSLELGAATNQPMSITNSGAVSTTFELAEVDRGFQPTFMAGTDRAVEYPALETQDGNPALAETGLAGEAVFGTPANPGNATAWDPWETMAPMPAGRVFNAVVAAGNYVYVIGGTSDAGGATPTNTVYRYNTGTNTWDTMANAPDTLMSPDGIAIGGKIYIPGDDTTADTFVYDIASNTWSTITANGGYTARSQYQVVAIGNKLYVLGGIVDAAGASTTEVWILDTAAGTWSAGVPMQKSRTSFSAAAMNGQIYVAGGVLFPGFTPDMTAEKFDGTSWSYIAGVPSGGGAYTRWSYNADGLGKDGLWLGAGRRDASWAVLNHAGYYNPTDNTWTDSPTIPTLAQGRVYMEGDVAADGYFYVIGGRDSAGAVIYTTNERLFVGAPGGGSAGVVWLDENPISGTVAYDGGVANINVTFDASTVAQPGDYYATINVKTSDPQKATYGVPVTMTVTAPATYGKLMGTVNGLQRCDVAPGTALADTDLVIEASNGMTWTTSTDTGGAYSLWLNQAYRPYTVTAAHTGYLTGLVSGLLITGQVTTTHNFDLRLLAPCASVPETEINSTQMSNQVATQTLHINNAGAASLNWNIQEAAPTSAVSAPSGNTSRIRLFEPNVDLSGWLNALLPLANIVSDGGFEAGTPNPYWDEYSSNFGTPLCTSAACGGTGGGTGPHTGTWWGWFGGIDTAVETGYLTQTVVITAGSAATLTFWLEIPASAGNGTDWMTVKMDNTPIFTATDLTTGYSPYAQVSLNVSTFANGQPRALKFESTTNGGAVTNFFVDDVVLDVTAGGPPPVGACQAEAIPWLTAVPISGTTAADGSSLVNLVFNSTGLVSGVYTGTLCVNTSDVGNPQVLVPVEMTVANPPVCDFTSSSPDDLGQTTTFNNLTVGDDPLVYRWDFGDGSPLSAAISPTHQYAQVGLYTVVMTATNNEGVDVCAGQVSIESVPIPSFTALPTRVNQPMAFNNTTLSNPPVTSWQWNFGDPASGSNNFSFAQSPTHTYSAAGTYTVTLIATNLKGLAQYQSAVLVVPVKIHLPLIMK